MNISTLHNLLLLLFSGRNLKNLTTCKALGFTTSRQDVLHIFAFHFNVIFVFGHDGPLDINVTDNGSNWSTVVCWLFCVCVCVCCVCGWFTSDNKSKFKYSMFQMGLVVHMLRLLVAAVGPVTIRTN